MRACGVLPADYWAMTPAESRWLIEGVDERENREWRRTATLISWLVGALTGKRLTVEQLMGEARDDAPTGAADRRARFRALMREAERREQMREAQRGADR
ncbi:MAG: hypothetical protein RQ723_12060 [Desulfuromonadales bacterium]|nr:hypothetical protein [Desulfuromonadales bacterium]